MLYLKTITVKLLRARANESGGFPGASNRMRAEIYHTHSHNLVGPVSWHEVRIRRVSF